MTDNHYVEGSSTPIAREDNNGNTYQMRELSDGSIHEVLKNFIKKDEFMMRITPFGEDSRFSSLEYFWLAQYRLKTGAEQDASAQSPLIDGLSAPSDRVFTL